MAKGGKLTIIKSVLKKIQSFKLGHTHSNSISVGNFSDECSSKDLHAVYIGKLWRRYFVTSEAVENMLFHELAERRGDELSITVGCEVVLFEHLL
ncbi:auxin-responsive protein SAUR78-like [Andrographis paniculata]|uniref:auxin-responsive protein SAUR78-like n=1 Tax=Andrographis paniculata TaxID=175694 RepID=UPI0021E988FB|nr:auxin-responsive protein SAUR78-like [Andrographis paniculata]